MTEGIQQLTKKNMHDVSNAINILDPSKTIDTKICGSGSWHEGNATETLDKCNTGGSAGSKSGFTKLSDMFTKDIGGSNKNAYPGDANKRMGEYSHTTAKIVKDMSVLNREQKGVVSSAFAKAHEGAEIVEIRSISTTSVMVNACYDVLTDGLPVHFLLRITQLTKHER